MSERDTARLRVTVDYTKEEIDEMSSGNNLVSLSDRIKGFTKDMKDFNIMIIITEVK